MRVAQGGTQMFCPNCGEVQVCQAVSPTDLGKSSGRRWYRKGHEDIQWFRRGRFCMSCHKLFMTAEVDECFLDELVELRNALANLKINAEEYMKESTAASGALDRLSKSLSVLRALKVYQEAGSQKHGEQEPVNGGEDLREFKLDNSFKTLIESGKEKGCLSYAQVNQLLPDDAVNPEQLNQLLLVLEEQGIELIDETEADLRHRVHEAARQEEEDKGHEKGVRNL